MSKITMFQGFSIPIPIPWVPWVPWVIPQDYTIVRPGFMGDVEARLPQDRSLALADDGGELKVTQIPHRSVAAARWWLAMDRHGAWGLMMMVNDDG